MKDIISILVNIKDALIWQARDYVFSSTNDIDDISKFYKITEHVNNMFSTILMMYFSGSKEDSIRKNLIQFMKDLENFITASHKLSKSKLCLDNFRKQFLFSSMSDYLI